MLAAKYAPEWESEAQRSVALGYEPPSDSCVRCLEHGYPTPLARWHRHEEYELHLIVRTTGHAFIHDYVGSFEPGNVFLIGPRVPHNWVSGRSPEQHTALRDLVMQFSDEPLRDAMKLYPELREMVVLLEHARSGIEFFDAADLVGGAYDRIRASRGLSRLARFLELLGRLATWKHYRVLSSAPVLHVKGDDVPDALARVLGYIGHHFFDECPSSRMANLAGMSEPVFSREFKRVTKLSVPEYVARLRIHWACKLLMETDLPVARIAYEAGFNNLANFNRKFLRLKGVAPSVFRQEASVRFEGANG